MKVLLSIFLLVMFGVFLAVFLLQKNMIFYPEKLAADFAFSFPGKFEERWISYQDKSGDFVKIHGLLFHSPAARSRILYFHGNAGSLSSWGEVAAELSSRLAAEVLIIDYPGFGKSSDALASNSEDLILMSEAAMKFFLESTNSELPTVLFGRSLGTGLASYLASKNTIAAVILETPYVSIEALARQIFPWLPTFLLRFDLANEKYLKNIKAPILLLHGTADEVIPYAHSKFLKEKSPKVIFVEIENGRHNDLANFQEYWRSLSDFVSTALPESGKSTAGSNTR